VRAAVATLLTRADALYRSGRSGLPALPPRLRLAVAAASDLYAAIGEELRARDCDALAGRVVVPRHRKARLFVTAAGAQLRTGVIRRQETNHAAT
ncbi:squalene/phytoene synthase family protein, partial [Roseovarius sp. SYSU LYC5161]|uniref:squalene/phytoene synthase family protein n=1 Tax=Roseovarius halophilus (ex Wu et al. 2025) TaxID=3376060 RepID=UPI00399A6C44